MTNLKEEIYHKFLNNILEKNIGELYANGNVLYFDNEWYQISDFIPHCPICDTELELNCFICQNCGLNFKEIY